LIFLKVFSLQAVHYFPLTGGLFQEEADRSPLMFRLKTDDGQTNRK